MNVWGTIQCIVVLVAAVIVWSFISSIGVGREKPIPSFSSMKEFKPKTQKFRNEIVGYKYLVWDENFRVWRSPVMDDWWREGILIAHEEPTAENEVGIHVGKDRGVIGDYETYGNTALWLVGVDADQPYVEHEYGYRATCVRQIKNLNGGLFNV